MDRHLTDVVVLDSPDGRRLENLPLISSETIGETGHLPSTLMKVVDGCSNPMKDANTGSVHGDH
jgi:hypothetical protein